MAKAKLVAATRAWLRAFANSQKKVDATLSGPKISIPLSISGEPQETRKGYNEHDKAPFYEMDRKRLWGYYSGYNSTIEYQYGIQYADILAFSQKGFHPVRDNRVDIENVSVKYDAVDYKLPETLKNHGQSAVDFFKKLGKLNYDPKSGMWENNTTIRLRKLLHTGITCDFTCHKVEYFHQVATNITLDWDSGKLPDGKSTIRSGIERPREGKLPHFHESILANNFGTAIMFYDRKLERTFVRVRSEEMGSIAQRGLHCTVSGVLELDPACKPGEYEFDFFLYGTHLEIKMETDLDPDQYLLYPVAFGRELPRGGKPQLFFVAVALVSDNEFELACQNAEERIEYIPNAKNTFFDELSTFEVSPSEAYTYEGWACQMLAEDFVRANKDKILEQVSSRAIPN